MGRIFALIVTYGDHKKQLSQVLHQTLINKRIDHIFVINNGSSYDLSQEIDEISCDKVSLISLATNTGSAGGFSRGILEVVEYSTNKDDRLLILDDDSYVEYDALEKIDSYERNMSKNYDHIWSLNRLKINEQAKIDCNCFDYSLESYYNSFYRFSVTNKFKRRNHRIKRENKNIKRMVVAPYSGLFINMSVIHKVGYPIQEMYLYSDDIEYTFRISSYGIDILQMYNANIRDIAGSWFDSKKINVHDAFFQTKQDNYRALYAYRNEAYLAKYVFNKNKILSSINYCTWILNILIRKMPKNKAGIKKFKKIIRMVHLGKKAELGELDI
ncbi:glycosyltransferase [Weissella paramesenteroides]|uniref:glycosyltransferase n=1 Tax=Weissella paramesenteroides TaxID=1249 RepID=UPI003F7469B8